MRTPAVKPAHALPFLLIPSAARRDTAYLPLFERAVTRHQLSASTKPRPEAQLTGARLVAPSKVPAFGTYQASHRHHIAPA